MYLVPNQFESSARLYVDADAILTPLLRGLAADSAPTSQLEVLQRTLLSRPNLEKVISKTDLDLSINGPSDRERLLQDLASGIQVKPQTKNLFTITYRNRSAKVAHDVVQTLLTIFVESATGSNRIDMENARRFLEHQISSYEQQLRAAEKRRADFRAKYSDILPPTLNTDAAYTSTTETARSNLRSLDGKLQDSIIARDTLRHELANTPPMLVVEAAPKGPVSSAGLAIPQGKSRLQEAEDQLTMLLLKDTDRHPDVIAQKKLIEALKASPEGAAPAAGSGDGGRAAPASAATSGNMPSGQRSVPNPSLSNSSGVASWSRRIQRSLRCSGSAQRQPNLLTGSRRCSASSRVFWPNIKISTVTTVCCGGTTKNCLAACSLPTWHRRLIHRPTRSSFRSWIRRRFRAFRRRPIDCSWSPASCLPDWVAVFWSRSSLDSSTAPSPRLTISEAWVCQCLAAFRSWGSCRSYSG